MINEEYAQDPSEGGKESIIIDSHVHFWKYDKKRDAWITDNMKVLKQNYLPEHLSQTLKRNHVSGVVAVQVDQSELETLFLIELSKTHEMIRGVVGWIDLKADNIEDRLNYFSQYPVLKGYRHIVQAEPADFLSNKSFLRGVRALQTHQYSYDILIYHNQLKQALAFVSRFPEQKFIIDHCAKPDIRQGEIKEWKILMREMATHPQLYCKLSGLFTEAKWSAWSAGDFYPYLDTVFESFGTDRLLYGSDWPVILLSGIYVQWKSLLEKYMEKFRQEEKDKVFGKNAIQYYGLG
jgi:L-fuconolactonase